MLARPGIFHTLIAFWLICSRTLMFICSAILPIAYFVGLLFTLKTHAQILHAKADDDDEDEEGLHLA